MKSIEQSTLYCDSCFNYKLAQLKRLREQKEKEDQARLENEQLEHMRKIAEYEKELYEQTRKGLRQEAQEFSRELDRKFIEKKSRKTENGLENCKDDYQFEFFEIRNKYKNDLLAQIHEKQQRKCENDREEKETERKHLEKTKQEAELSMQELNAEFRIQREKYRHELARQIHDKTSRKNEEAHQKKLEKLIIDEQVKRFKQEQDELVSLARGVHRENLEKCSELCRGELGSCSNCNKTLPIQALNKFSS